MAGFRPVSLGRCRNRQLFSTLFSFWSDKWGDTKVQRVLPFRRCYSAVFYPNELLSTVDGFLPVLPWPVPQLLAFFDRTSIIMQYKSRSIAWSLAGCLLSPTCCSDRTAYTLKSEVRLPPSCVVLEDTAATTDGRLHKLGTTTLLILPFKKATDYAAFGSRNGNVFAFSVVSPPLSLKWANVKVQWVSYIFALSPPAATPSLPAARTAHRMSHP